MSVRSAGLVAILAVACLVTSVLGALSAQDPRDVYQDRTDVLEVQVPVNVVGRDGNSVRELTRGDFTILQDGMEQEITGFQVVDLDLIEPVPGNAELASRQIPAAARRYFLFLFDLSFSSPTAIVRARGAAREFVLQDLHSTDLAAVATHTIEGGTRLIMTFSPDRAQLARAIDTLGAPRLLQLKDRDPLRFLVDLPEVASRQATPDVGGSASGVDQNTRLTLARYLSVVGKQIQKMEKSYARGRIASWTTSMTEMASLLGSIQGRKHVVFFSEGFDGRLLFGRQPDFDDQENQQDNRNILDGQYWMVDNDDRLGNTHLQGDMRQMLNQFRKSNAVVQAVDISGLSAAMPAERRARRVAKDALFYIANETGGTLFEEANNFGDQLRKVLRSSTVTYLLSFTPKEQGEPGEFHRLRVKANAPRGARLSFRSAYQVPEPFEDMHPIERGLLAANLIATATERDDLDMKVLVAPFRANETEAYVPVIVELGGRALLDAHSGDTLTVEFYTYVTDHQNQMKDFFTQLVTLDLTGRREAVAATGLKYYGHVNLGPGSYLLRVLARNAVSGRTAVRTVPLEVPEYSSQEALLLPPFFIEDPGSWFLVREQSSSNAYQASRVYPFTVNGEPYIPAAHPALRPGAAVDLCLVGYNMGEADLEVNGEVHSLDGATMRAGSFVLQERTVTGIGGLDKWLATFDPTGLEAGDYTLEVSIRNPTKQLIQQNSIPFSVPVEGP